MLNKMININIPEPAVISAKITDSMKCLMSNCNFPFFKWSTNKFRTLPKANRQDS